MTTIQSHVEEIEHVASGGTSVRDQPVVQSWLRCLNDYKLDPSAPQRAYIVPHATLREHQEQAEELIRISRSGLSTLFDHVAEQNYVLLLSDARGVAVDYLGHPRMDRELRKAGLYLGAEWSESRAGTCAVGACMASREAVVIHQDDHFDPTHTGLSCTAAPIFDTLGDLAAVLDISQLCSPTAKTSQQLALNLVTATARRIELANLVARTRDEWVLRLSRLPDFLDIDPDAAISLDGSGRITGMTHGGFDALRRAVGMQVPATRALLGQPISRFFDLEIDDLPRYMRGRPAGERLLHANGEPLCFASAMSPAKPHARRAAAASQPLPGALSALSFGDAHMDAIQHRAARFGARSIAMLIQGETGTGKEMLARAIHESYGRRGAFIAVNCAAIPEHLIESELFGYVPNAFTGAAKSGKTGLIEAADGGTLFLDEIGDMPTALQSRLLRVLSEGEVTPVGGHKPRPVRLQVISATHRQLAELVAEGRFREDLYYRLNAATLRLPALRERQDFDALVNHLLRNICDRYDEEYRLEESACRILRQHDWPGNLRELRNALEVGCALCENHVVKAADLPADVRHGESRGSGLSIQLAACDGNVSELARRLGVNRSTVHRRLKREGSS
ncbi:sigma-54-dependent Fis family transcriptional regulator [Salinisphaera aquimarina]|uniref:Sigma-54-dependent Fis family transcriptional regulator n=1 Tax=Salinisphaera aquimarina TaxID=2094031 RepID=A0ABV7ER73_9GAMM